MRKDLNPGTPAAAELSTTAGGLDPKRRAARGHRRGGWIAGDGVVGCNQNQIERLTGGGEPGVKGFLIHDSIDGFTMVTEQELRAALPHVARTGLPLLVHAELPGPVDAERKGWRARTGASTQRTWSRGRMKRSLPRSS